MTLPVWIFVTLWVGHVAIFLVFFGAKSDSAASYSEFMSVPIGRAKPAWAEMTSKVCAYAFVALILLETFVI